MGYDKYRVYPIYPGCSYTWLCLVAYTHEYDMAILSSKVSGYPAAYERITLPKEYLRLGSAYAEFP